MNCGVVQVDLGERAYNVIIADGLSKGFTANFASIVNGRKCLIVSDSNVFPLYGKLCERALTDAGAAKIGHFSFEAGEASKNIATLERIYHAAVCCGLDRTSVIVALGGGVVGDLSGFAAATFMRGIDVVQIPTTLLSMVDSSVGGKTGIDLPEGKNLVGAFWQPKLVLVDTQFLSTLPRRELTAGEAEVIKYGLILDVNLFSRIENSTEDINKGESEYFVDLVSACCQLKADVVMADEKESGLRSVLNFGHTFGHAIEAVTGYNTYLHGEAVSIGIVIASELSMKLGLLDNEAVGRIRSTLVALGLPVKVVGVKPDDIIKAIGFDKKTVGGKPRFVILHGIGGAQVSKDVKASLVDESIRCCCD